MAVGEALALGIVANVLSDAMRKPLKGLRVEVQRRQDLARILGGSDRREIGDQEATFLKALDDVVRHIAHADGSYTERVEGFFQELRRTAIPSSLFQTALVSAAPDAIYSSFLLVFNSFAPLPFEPRPLFDALFYAVDTRIAFAAEDPVVLETLRAVMKETRHSLSTLHAALSRAGSIAAPLNSDEYTDARFRVAKSVEAENKEVAVETDRGPKRHSITKLVVPARLLRADELSPELPLTRERDASLGLIDFRRDFDRATILGDPGGGKSTATQYLCFDLARQIILATNNPLVRAFENRDIRVPLKITIRTLDKRQQVDPAYSILDYITDEIKRVLDNDEILSSRFLIQCLVTGNAIVLFDGLDEILDISRRRHMVDQIEQFSAVYATSSILVTSRIVGYKDAPLNHDFIPHVLSRFNDSEIVKFSTNLISVVKKIRKSDANILSKTFVSQTETIAADLRANPLMLGLMVYLFVERGVVPDNRPEIYKQCSHLMFEKWDQNRGIRYALPPNFRLMDVFGHVATRIFGNTDAEDGVSRDWLVSEVQSFFEEWYGDRPRAVEASNALVNFITGRAWVMCDVGPDMYKFTHRTFLEYFVARRLESQSKSVSELIHTLYAKIVTASWDVVTHLALQIATDSGPKAAHAADTILALLDDSALSGEEEVNLLYFSSKCLEYLDLPEPLYRSLSDSIISRSWEIGVLRGDTGVYLIANLTFSSRRNGAPIKAAIYSRISRSLLLEREKRFSWLLLASNGYSDRFNSSAGYAAHFEYGAFFRTFFDECRETHRPSIEFEANLDPETARAYWGIYGDYKISLYETHGPSLLIHTSHVEDPTFYNLTPYAIFLNAVHHVYGRHLRERDADSAFAVMRLFAMDALSGRIAFGDGVSRAGAVTYESRNYLEIGMRRLSALISGHQGRSQSRVNDAAILFIALLVFVEVDDRMSAEPADAQKNRFVSRNTIFSNLGGGAKSAHFWQSIEKTEVGKAATDWAKGELDFLH